MPEGQEVTTTPTAGAIEQHRAPTREQIDLIKNTVAVGATDSELQLFLYVAHKRGLDPLLAQIHFIKRRKKNPKTQEWEEVGTIQTGIDGLRLISERTKKLAGIKRGCILENGVLVGGWAEVFRSDWKEPARNECYLEEYMPMKDGEPMGLWRTLKRTMIMKCAEAGAHRMAFAEDTSGLFTDDEMGQADTLLTVTASTESKPPQNNPYWCKEHEVVWFKKGNMRGFAHPVEGGGWCNMPTPKTEPKTEANPTTGEVIEGEVVEQANTAPEGYDAAQKAANAKAEPGKNQKTVQALRGEYLEAMKGLTQAQRKTVMAVNGSLPEGNWTHSNYQAVIDKAHELSAEKPQERMV